MTVYECNFPPPFAICGIFSCYFLVGIIDCTGMSLRYTLMATPFGLGWKNRAFDSVVCLISFYTCIIPRQCFMSHYFWHVHDRCTELYDSYPRMLLINAPNRHWNSHITFQLFCHIRTAEWRLAPGPIVVHPGRFASFYICLAHWLCSLLIVVGWM